MRGKLLKDFCPIVTGVWFSPFRHDGKEGNAFIVALMGYGFLLYRE